MWKFRYPKEKLAKYEDNGTMPENVAALEEAVIGRKIVSVEKLSAESYWSNDGAIITLDNGKQVFLKGTSDCCAYTALEQFLLHPDKVDHAILGVGTTDGYTKWHIYADYGDVLELQVGWSCGNPFYYGYGFTITVEDVPDERSEQANS